MLPRRKRRVFGGPVSTSAKLTEKELKAIMPPQDNKDSKKKEGDQDA